MQPIVVLGRILFSAIFILSAPSHFSSADIDAASNAGLQYADILVPLAGVAAVLGGLSVLLGYRARLGAFLIIVFLVPVTLIMHAFWNAPDDHAQMLQVVNFMKNASMCGAALMILGNGAGPWSFDARRYRLHHAHDVAEAA